MNRRKAKKLFKMDIKKVSKTMSKREYKYIKVCINVNRRYLNEEWLRFCYLMGKKSSNFFTK